MVEDGDGAALIWIARESICWEAEGRGGAIIGLGMLLISIARADFDIGSRRRGHVLVDDMETLPFETNCTFSATVCTL